MASGLTGPGNKLAILGRPGLVVAKRAFSPSDIAGLAVWYDATKLSLSSGAAVAFWPDSSGNGNTASQGTAADQPTYQAAEINGHPAVVFDGTDDFMTTAAFGTALSVGTMFVVSQIKTNTAAYFFDGIVEADRWAMAEALATAGQLGAFAGGTLISYAQALPTEYNQWTATFTGTTTSALYKNGALVAGPANMGNAVLTGLTLGLRYGATGAGQYLDSGMGELIVYDSVLSTTDRQKVEAYQKTKWGTP